MDKGVLQAVEAVTGQFVSNVFLREKKEKEKFPMILNLKDLNQYIEYHHFKMDTLETALTMITPGFWFTSLDFTDVYYSLAIHEKDRKFLRFSFQGQLYEYMCLPNGLRSGPGIFMKLLKVLSLVLRQSQGMLITGYIDDTLLIADSEEKSRLHTAAAAEWFQNLGFMLSDKKSVVLPMRRIEYLGFLIDAEAMVVTLPHQKALGLRDYVGQMRSKTVIVIRELLQLLGVLLVTNPGNDLAKLFCKQMDIEKNQALWQNAWRFEAKVQF